jgi:hypothetical protein
MSTMTVTLTRSLLGVLVLGHLAGCLFQPREPEPPASGSEVVYLPRGQAVNVLANAELALNARDAAGWDDVISDSFSYGNEVPNEQDFPWDSWDKSHEMTFINNFFNNVTNVEMNLRETDIFVDDPAGGEAIWEFIYFLRVTDVNGLQTRYRAKFEVTLRLIGSFWYIDRWVDESSEADPETGDSLPTMGSLRSAFASK